MLAAWVTYARRGLGHVPPSPGHVSAAAIARRTAFEHDLAGAGFDDFGTGGEPHPAIDGLGGLGYEYLGEDGRRPGRYFWRKRGVTAFNVSAVPYLGTMWQSNLAVRDFLRTRPEWVERYG